MKASRRHPTLIPIETCSGYNKMNFDLLPAISIKQTSGFVESRSFLCAEISFSSFFYVGVIIEGGSQETDDDLKPHIELAFM